MIIESVFVKELYPEDQVAAAAERLSTKRVAVLTSAAMTIALERKFASIPSREQISAYASELASGYAGTEPRVKPLVVEGIIRAQLGEVELYRDMSMDDIVPHQILVAYNIFSRLSLDEAGLNGILDESLALADEAA